jgi:SAM-dependent methyltransferase
MDFLNQLKRLTRRRRDDAHPLRGPSGPALALLRQGAMIPHVDDDAPAVSEGAFVKCLRASDSYTEGGAGRQAYIDASIPRLYRITANMLRSRTDFRGPTLDVASGWGILYPCFRKFIPGMLPYSVAERTGGDQVIDGELIRCNTFECDKDVLPLDDASFGTVTFFDCLEHLIVDPIWTILEFNRVLKRGGHLVISTPNAAAGYRVFSIFQGENPASENDIKPASIYQRHNREWTLAEVGKLMQCCGFQPRSYSTNAWAMPAHERNLLDQIRQLGVASNPHEEFGPELFVIGEKVSEKTLSSQLSPNERWPDWLYSRSPNYHRRPKLFPIVVGDDYA